MVVNLSYSFIPLQKILQRDVDRPVENPRKHAKNTKMAPHKLCCMHEKLKTHGSTPKILRWRRINCVGMHHRNASLPLPHSSNICFRPQASYLIMSGNRYGGTGVSEPFLPLPRCNLSHRPLHYSKVTCF